MLSLILFEAPDSAIETCAEINRVLDVSGRCNELEPDTSHPVQAPARECERAALRREKVSQHNDGVQRGDGAHLPHPAARATKASSSQAAVAVARHLAPLRRSRISSRRAVRTSVRRPARTHGMACSRTN